MSQKGNSILILLLVFLIAGVVGLIGYMINQNLNSLPVTPAVQKVTKPSPSPNLNPESTSSSETANWKTYTSSNLGYTIKYPADKFIDCSIGGDIFALRYKSSNNTTCAAGEGIPNLSTVVFDKNREAAESRFSECYSTEQELVKIGNIMGTKYTNTRNANDACNNIEIAYARSRSYILINHEGTVFQVILAEFSNQELKITQEILSTFKFTQ